MCNSILTGRQKEKNGRRIEKKKRRNLHFSLNIIESNQGMAKLCNPCVLYISRAAARFFLFLIQMLHGRIPNSVFLEKKKLSFQFPSFFFFPSVAVAVVAVVVFATAFFSLP